MGVGDSIGDYNVSEILTSSSLGQTQITLKKAVAYSYSIEVAGGYNGTSLGNNDYIVFKLKKGNGSEYYSAVPVTIPANGTASIGTVPAFYAYENSNINFSKTAVYADVDTVSSCLVHMNSTKESWETDQDYLKKVIALGQYDGNSNTNGKKYTSGDAIDNYTLNIRDSSGSSVHTLTKAPSATITVKYEDYLQSPLSPASGENLLPAGEYYVLARMQVDSNTYGWISTRLTGETSEQSFNSVSAFTRQYTEYIESQPVIKTETKYLTGNNRFDTYIVKFNKENDEDIFNGSTPKLVEIR